jgi:membrane-associated phospholipid phosphatase
VCLPDETVKCWDERLAGWVSDALCPPVVAALSIVTVAAYPATPAAWKWVALFLALAVATPTLYVIWLLYRSEVTDFHLRVREQRIKPMIVIVTTTLSAWLMLIAHHAPTLLAAAPMMLSVPLVAWARVRLRRHTLAQTLAGAALGTLTSLAFYLARSIR